MHVKRPTEEQNKIIEEIAEKCFGQKNMGIEEIRELGFYLCSLAEKGESPDIDEIFKKFPILAKTQDINRWYVFKQILSDIGIKDTIKGAEHKEDQIKNLLNKNIITNSKEEDYYYEF